MKETKASLSFYGTTTILVVLLCLGSIANFQQPNLTDLKSEEGLTAYWKFDEGVGDVAYDSSGNGNHGTIYGASWTDGKFGKALFFDGDDLVQVEDSNALDGFNEISIEAWVKPLLGERGAIVSRWFYEYEIPINERVYELTVEPDGKVEFGLSSDGSNGIWLESSIRIKNNTWNHIAAVSDGENMRIYINGIQDPNIIDAPETLHSSDNPLQIGAWNYSPNQTDTYFKGVMDEVKIYNRALTEKEIQDHYFSGIKTGVAHGMVTNKTGEPVENVKIICEGFLTETNSSGEYTLRLPVGTHVIVAGKRGYRSGYAEVEISSGQSLKVDFKLVEGPSVSNVILWDTMKCYFEKNPFHNALANKENWIQVPYSLTNYTFIGDPMIENEHYYLFLFSNDEDSPDLVAKLDNGNYWQNEIYKVHDTGYRNFGMGRMWTKIVKNTPNEVIVISAEKGLRFGPPPIPITTLYRIPNRPWLEVRPVENVNQQGMHSKTRLAAFVFQNATGDILLDGKKHGNFSENVYPPEGCVGELNLHRTYSFDIDYDFMWFLTFPPGAETNELTYQGIHYPDPYWEWDCKPCAPSVGAQYAYLAEKVVIGVLHYRDIWKREDIKQSISAGETYTSSFTAPYSGKWRIFAVMSNDDHYITEYFAEAVVDQGENFTFTSPVNGTLEYIVMYMIDRTEETPPEVYTPMDIYKETISDTVAPQILSVYHEPQIIEPYQNVTVYAEIKDQHLAEAVLSYSTNRGETWNNVSMNHIENCTYTAQIPQLPENTTVWYKIIAYDYSGNMAIKGNDGEYYTYVVIPEFPKPLAFLTIFSILTVVLVLLNKSKKEG